MSDENKYVVNELEGEVSYVIKALSKQSEVRYFMPDQLGKPMWVNTISEAMSFPNFDEAEIYIMENLIIAPTITHEIDGGATYRLPGIMNADILPLSLGIEEIKTTYTAYESDDLNILKDAFNDVIEQLDAELVVYRKELVDPVTH